MRNALNILIDANDGTLKYNIIRRYVENKSVSDEYFMMEGFDFKSKDIFVDGKFYKFNIWQTLHCFNLKNKFQFRKFQGIMFVFYLGWRNLFEEIKEKINFAKELGIEIIIAGCECGSKSAIYKEEAEKFAHENGCHYFDISVKQNYGLDEAFTYLSTKIIHRFVININK